MDSDRADALLRHGFGEDHARSVARCLDGSVSHRHGTVLSQNLFAIYGYPLRRGRGSHRERKDQRQTVFHIVTPLSGT